MSLKGNWILFASLLLVLCFVGPVSASPPKLPTNQEVLEQIFPDVLYVPVAGLFIGICIWPIERIFINSRINPKLKQITLFLSEIGLGIIFVSAVSGASLGYVIFEHSKFFSQLNYYIFFKKLPIFGSLSSRYFAASDIVNITKTIFIIFLSLAVLLVLLGLWFLKKKITKRKDYSLLFTVIMLFVSLLFINDSVGYFRSYYFKAHSDLWREAMDRQSQMIEQLREIIQENHYPFFKSKISLSLG